MSSVISELLPAGSETSDHRHPRSEGGHQTFCRSSDLSEERVGSRGGRTLFRTRQSRGIFFPLGIYQAEIWLFAAGAAWLVFCGGASERIVVETSIGTVAGKLLLGIYD